MEAYFAFSGRGDVGAARRAAERYRDCPVPKWREKFSAIANQLAEIEEASSTGVQVAGTAAAALPTAEFTIRYDSILIKCANVPSVELNLYLMDAELLFSTNPFMQGGGGSGGAEQLGLVVPNRTFRYEIPPSGELVVPLPGELTKANARVELKAGPLRRTAMHLRASLTVSVRETDGTLVVTSNAADAPGGDPSVARRCPPVIGAYVKVYALSQGKSSFYKDGYTDRRGMFDYVSLDTSNQETAEKFAIFVADQALGAQIKEVQNLFHK